MPTKASALKGQRTYIRIGIVNVDENMIMQVEEGSCGVTDKNGKLLG
jgi:hypothetical protein